MTKHGPSPDNVKTSHFSQIFVDSSSLGERICAAGEIGVAGGCRNAAPTINYRLQGGEEEAAVIISQLQRSIIKISGGGHIIDMISP